jgi:hypothetical protein
MPTERDRKPDLASAMWPALSRDAKAREAQQARADAARKADIRRLVSNLDELVDGLRKERGQR